ncbi:MAG TPA: reverse transcriptase-like protein [Galbitalea sp.]|jgi:probable phosphoglycerate mutase|nr:reverse transcriptase-like protein [Galbitalea sp.]
MAARELIVEADGGSRGNPGVAGSGSIVIDARTGEVLAEVGTYVGIASNNVAEYRGLIAGIRKALEIEPDANLHIRMDSKLVIEQMSGRWKIKHPDMADLAAEARQLLTGTPVSFEWMPRMDNSRADKIANEVMDTKRSFQRGAAGDEKRMVRFE